MPEKLITVLNCTRPVLFRNDSTDFPLSFGGTAFLVKFEGRTFVITAKHVLREQEFALSQFRVQCDPNGNALLPLGLRHRIRGSDATDTDQYDIAVWDVLPISDAVYGDYRPYALHSLEGNTIFTEAAHYLYRGYPQRLRIADYTTQRYEQGSITGSAKYIGRTESDCIRKLEFHDLSKLDDIDGVSGSPVFQVTEDRDAHGVPSFAGMIIRGSAQSRSARFVESRRIIDMLETIVAGRAIPSGT